jgi:hypothetical protein
LRAVCAALALVVACEKAHHDEPAPPLSTIRYAARTDNALDRTNSTYFSIVEDDVLFVLADAPNPRASEDAAKRLTAAYAKDCRDQLGDDRVACAVAHTSGSAIAAVAIEGNVAHVASVGEVPVLFRHGHTLSPGDSLLLVNQRLLDALGRTTVRAAMPDMPSSKDELEAAVARLLDDSKPWRKPQDPATAILVQLVR